MYEKTISSKTVFEGRILSVDVLDVELEDGRMSVREIVRHGVAVAIVPQRPDGRFVFIRQFRKAMERVCFEVVAGNCDPGEAEAVSAARELQEETGYTAESLELLGSIFPSVGYCTERIDIYFATVAEQGATSFDEDENIETVILAEAEMDEMIRSNQIADAKTLAAWMLYKAKKG
ncbi:NUDIX domain-containing protein [Pontiella sulfatireligans]|uniref:GDP-mannose pyrophosphatase n=1 Tax=Pontiella sulfatireligans TaxID=2750658 RepID=A0A6C2URW1_9BACT|nr:NUDIX hydrolase [Pontiella sulfatireligans]VGO23080.1 Methanol dehydrogenase activator [Pontiella sulfatireligans]